MSMKLTYEEAKKVYDLMTSALPDNDEEFMEYYNLMVLQAGIRYANIRAGWNLKTREQKMDEDGARTSAHDTWISGLKSLARNEGDAGKNWLQILDEADRKRMGDYACYVAMFLGVEAR